MEVSIIQAYSEDWDTGSTCDPYLLDNINENAQFYCTDWDEFLCDTCAGNHITSNASRQLIYRITLESHWNVI